MRRGGENKGEKMKRRKGVRQIRRHFSLTWKRKRQEAKGVKEGIPR